VLCDDKQQPVMMTGAQFVKNFSISKPSLKENHKWGHTIIRVVQESTMPSGFMFHQQKTGSY
jgi:hypothetical protein